MAKAIKYVICPGWIRSDNDDQRHYISASQLMRLYGVRPDECVVYPSRGIDQDHFQPPEGAVFLRPRYGDYRIPN